MKILHTGIAVLVMTVLLSAAPVQAMEMVNSGAPFTPQETCDGRIAEITSHRETKAGVHASLNARQDSLEARAAKIMDQAEQEGIDDSALAAAIAQSRLNQQAVDAAYQILDATWANAEANACDMSAQDFAKAVSYQSPVAQNFERLGDAAGVYITNTVEPLIQNLTDAVLSTK